MNSAPTPTTRTIRNRALVWGAVFIAGLMTCGVSVGPAAATTPPTNPPPAPAADSSLPPAATTQGTDPAAASDQGAVESWALAPTGSLDGNLAGNRPNLTYDSDPGAVINDSITVFNYGNVQLTFRLYGTDAFNNDDGKFDLLAGSKVPVDVGSWVKLAVDTITLPPGKQASIPITITIPADAAPGDHAGAILASNVSQGTDDSGAIVNLDRRTGTRMYIRLSGPLTPQLAVADVQTTYHHALNSFGGSADVKFRIENRGNVRLQATATVAMAGPFGLGETKIALPPIAEILPGQHIDLSATLEGVPALMLDSTTVHLTPSDVSGGADLAATTGTDATFAPPIALLLLLIIVIFGLLAKRAHRRRGAAEQAVLDAAHDFESLPYREPQHQSS
ncbi:MAG: hypothetical protein JWL72_4257 [Ilumatobacteraceae bacterium]|nr:hypothetical protein [Ilumatobacteraceae bacterium]